MSTETLKTEFAAVRRLLTPMPVAAKAVAAALLPLLLPIRLLVTAKQRMRRSGAPMVTARTPRVTVLDRVTIDQVAETYTPDGRTVVRTRFVGSVVEIALADDGPVRTTADQVAMTIAYPPDVVAVLRHWAAGRHPLVGTISIGPDAESGSVGLDSFELAQADGNGPQIRSRAAPL